MKRKPTREFCCVAPDVTIRQRENTQRETLGRIFYRCFFFFFLMILTMMRRSDEFVVEFIRVAHDDDDVFSIFLLLRLMTTKMRSLLTKAAATHTK
tara:strand:- start:103 stop:390 length:288 start_codon:yes stop_codon:yes gene_type:complete